MLFQFQYIKDHDRPKAIYSIILLFQAKVNISFSFLVSLFFVFFLNVNDVTVTKNVWIFQLI